MYSPAIGDQPFLTKSAQAFFENNSDLLVDNVATVQDPRYQQHFARSQEAISQAIEGLVKDTAIILGSGGMKDLPLQALVGFKRIVFVDVDLRYTKKALEGLPEELKEKCQFETADLTGFFSEFTAKADHIAQEHLPYDEFVSRILDIFPTLKRKKFNYQSMKASFVCSSLVCSQLPGGVANYLQDLSRRVFDRSFEVPPSKIAEFNEYLTEIQTFHIDELRQLVEPNGRAYFADHFSEKGIARILSPIEEVEITLGENYYAGAEKVQAHVHDVFSTVSANQWGWYFFHRESKGSVEVTEEDGSLSVIETQVFEFRARQITSLTLKPDLRP